MHLDICGLSSGVKPNHTSERDEAREKKKKDEREQHAETVGIPASAPHIGCLCGGARTEHKAVGKSGDKFTSQQKNVARQNHNRAAKRT